MADLSPMAGAFPSNVRPPSSGSASIRCDLSPYPTFVLSYSYLGRPRCVSAWLIPRQSILRLDCSHEMSHFRRGPVSQSRERHAFTGPSLPGMTNNRFPPAQGSIPVVSQPASRVLSLHGSEDSGDYDRIANARLPARIHAMLQCNGESQKPAPEQPHQNNPKKKQKKKTTTVTKCPNRTKQLFPKFPQNSSPHNPTNQKQNDIPKRTEMTPKLTMDQKKKQTPLLNHRQRKKEANVYLG